MVTKAAAASSDAALKASKLQLDLVQEQTSTLQQLITETRSLRDDFQADKELIENLVAGLDAYQERMNTQIEAMIKLHTEMRMYYEKIIAEKR